MNKKNIQSFALAALLLFPFAASAEFDGIKSLIKAVGALVQQLTALAAGAGLLAFFWGIVRFLFAAGGDEKAITEGKKFMGWGLVALFVMMSVWGIIEFFQTSLGLPHSPLTSQP